MGSLSGLGLQGLSALGFYVFRVLGVRGLWFGARQRHRGI